MTRRLHIWFIVVGALALSGIADVAAAQQPPRVDPKQFPALVNRKAFQRWEYEFEQRAFPLGDIPAGAKQRAVRQIQQARSSPSTAPVPGSTWANIGPAPILGGQIGVTTGTREMSGRVAAIATHPIDPNHWLIGAAQGGVWRTLNGGTTWTALTDAEASLSMGAIAFAPNNPNVIYAGTGEANFSGDSYAGQGLLKSIDGGATWQLLAPATFAKTTFSGISVHSTDPNTVLAATAHGIGGSVSVRPPDVPLRGIFKSVDGGATWSRKLTGVATSLKIDPTNFSRQLAGIGDIFGQAIDPTVPNGVYRSVDGGETWSQVGGPWSMMPGGVGRIDLAIGSSNPNVAYASIQDSFNGVGTDGGLLGLFVTTNAWDPTPAWTQIPTGATDNGTGVHGYCGWDRAFGSPSDQCWYNNVIAVDPTNSNILYAGGIPLWKLDSAIGSWIEVSQTVTNPLGGIHVDQHALAFAGTRLVAGNDGGVWTSVDGGATWADHNTNLSTVQFYAGALHSTDPNFAMGGSQDNGTERWTGTSSWPLVFGGDGAPNAISATNPNTNWMVSFQRLGLRRTTNGGATFSAADTGINKTGVRFIAPVEKCPANDNVFIAGTNTIWRTTNFFSSAPASPAWLPNSPAQTSGISALAFAGSDAACNTYAFGVANGQLRLTANGGATWVDIDPANAVPNRAITDLAFDPTNANVLYVTLSGFDEGTPGQPGHVFKTTNALAAPPTWTNVSPPVNIPANTVVLDPFDPTLVYVGTDVGVEKSTNGGATWTHMGPAVGMPNVAVFDLQINHATSRLVAFTHGRGAFALQGTTPVNADLAVTKSGSPNPVTVGNPLTYTVGVTNNGPGASTGVTLTDTLPGGVTFNSASSTQGTCTQAAGTVSCVIGNLATAASATVTIVVTPNAPGTITNTASVAGNEPDPNPANNTASTTTTVNAGQPGVSLSPTSLNFGSQPVLTTSSPQTVTVTNSSSAPLNVAGVSTGGVDALEFTVTGETCTTAGPIAPGGSCSASVTFGPSRSGPKSASLDVSSDAPGSPHSASLSGTGTEPNVGLSPASLNFGDQTVGTTSPPQTVTVTNTGTAPLVVATVTINGPSALDYAAAETCTAAGPIAPGGSCSASVTFSPLAAGPSSASLAIDSNAPGSPHSVPLDGNGTLPVAPARAEEPVLER